MRNSVVSSETKKYSGSSTNAPGTLSAMPVMHRFRLRKSILYLVLVAILVLVSTRYWCQEPVDLGQMVPQNAVQYASDGRHSYPYDRNMPLVFIGGMPRSGTTLIRAMLDAHPEVRCGEETRVIPRLLGMKTQWVKSDKESRRLLEAGLTDEVLSSAIAAFILEVIAKHGEPAPRLCNKDPFALKSTMELAGMFPNAKFLLMIRDGRAVAHSIVTRKVTISGFDIKSYRNCLEKWNSAVENMYLQCMRVGFNKCMPVYYEQLVLHPESMLRKILQFLDIPWHDNVLHHEELINKPGGVSLSRIEKSTDQVIKPVNLEALTKWATSFPSDLKSNVRVIAPMLVRLGYDPDAYPPNYGKADSFVTNNTMLIKHNEAYWNKQAIAVQQLTKTLGQDAHAVAPAHTHVQRPAMPGQAALKPDQRAIDAQSKQMVEPPRENKAEVLQPQQQSQAPKMSNNEPPNADKGPAR